MVNNKTAQKSSSYRQSYHFFRTKVLQRSSEIHLVGADTGLSAFKLFDLAVNHLIDGGVFGIFQFPSDTYKQMKTEAQGGTHHDYVKHSEIQIPLGELELFLEDMESHKDEWELREQIVFGAIVTLTAAFRAGRIVSEVPLLFHEADREIKKDAKTIKAE